MGRVPIRSLISTNERRRKFITKIHADLLVFLVPPPPRVAAVKKLYLVHCGKCRGFFVNVFVETEGRISPKQKKNAKLSRHFSPISCNNFARPSLWGIAGTTFLRCLRTPGAAIRKILVQIGVLPCLVCRPCLRLLGLAIYYLVLQACISFCSVSDKSGALLFLPCLYKSAAAQIRLSPK